VCLLCCCCCGCVLLLLLLVLALLLWVFGITLGSGWGYFGVYPEIGVAPIWGYT
jgi:hypothetical protein